MANPSYIMLTLVVVIVLQFIVFVVAEGMQDESPLAKRRRLSIQRLRNSGRLRRIFKKSSDLPETEGYVEDDWVDPAEFLEFLDELNALERLKENSFESDKRGGERRKNGWLTGMFGKRSSPSIRQARNIPQAYLSGDYFGKRFTDSDENWKRAYNIDDAREEEVA